MGAYIFIYEFVFVYSNVYVVRTCVGNVLIIQKKSLSRGHVIVVCDVTKGCVMNIIN